MTKRQALSLEELTVGDARADTYKTKALNVPAGLYESVAQKGTDYSLRNDFHSQTARSRNTGVKSAFTMTN